MKKNIYLNKKIIVAITLSSAYHLYAMSKLDNRFFLASILGKSKSNTVHAINANIFGSFHSFSFTPHQLILVSFIISMILIIIINVIYVLYN